MLKIRSLSCAALLTMMLPIVAAQEYSVEVIDSAPEADEVSAELAEQLAETGYLVRKGTSRTVCEIWFCRQWTVEPGFKVTEERLYPFSPGQLIGLLHFKRRGKDFRDQSVSSGWYTLRFGLQPTDGNHEGTSPTRDFVMLVNAEQDKPDKKWDLKELLTVSADAAGSTHPALMCMQRATDGAEPVMRHDESHDWWILHVTGNGIDGQKPVKVPVDLIVAGHALE